MLKQFGNNPDPNLLTLPARPNLAPPCNRGEYAGFVLFLPSPPF
jgi:hypothetical protein